MHAMPRTDSCAQDILLLGNDMIIPRDIRDWGTAWITEPQVRGGDV